MPDDSSTNLVPWVFQGLDRTTQRRLRLPRGVTDNLPGLMDGVTVAVNGEELQHLKEFFSGRELALTRQLLVVPFMAADRLVAAFLIVDSESAPREEGFDLGEIEAAGGSIARKLEEARAVLGHGSRGEDEPVLRSRLAKILSESSDEGLHVTIVRVDLARVTTELMRDRTRADLYRFQRDLAGALATMVSEAGELYSLGEHTALIVVQSRNRYSEQLLVHQLSQGVSALFSSAPHVDRLVERVGHFPNSEQTIDEVIHSILA